MRRPLLACFLLSAALFVSASAPCASSAEGQSASVLDLSAFAGTYVFTGGVPEERRLRSAIDSVVDRLNVFIREIARMEIHRAISPERRLHIGFDNHYMLLTMDDWGPIRIPINHGTSRTRGPDGHNARVSARAQDGLRLVERQRNDRGWRTNIFQLSEDRNRLTMTVRIGADQLPTEISYQLSFQRAN